jgi:hypothetical protein
MKLLALLLAAAGLSGCVAYPYAPGYSGYAGDAYYGRSYYGAGVPYVVEQPSYFYGGVYGGGYSRGNGYRDRDRDRDRGWGSRDRDGDGVPNRADSRPNDSRRR